MVKFPITLNSYFIVGLVDLSCINVSRSIGKSIGEGFGNF